MANSVRIGDYNCKAKRISLRRYDSTMIQRQGLVSVLILVLGGERVAYTVVNYLKRALLEIVSNVSSHAY